MRSSLLCIALLGCLLGAAHGAASSVFLVDSEAGAYLQSSSESVTVSAAGLSSLISALDGLLPPAEVDADVSSAINSVVKASPLRKPRAHVVLNVPGIKQEELAQVFGSKQLREVQVSGEQSSSKAVVEALGAIASANPGLHLVLLDHQGLEGCIGNCIAEYMQATAEAMGAQFDANRITFAGAVLDLSNMADKAFAVEAAAVFSGLQANIKSSAGALDDILVLEATMVSLHALRHAYGADSEQLLAAKAGMVRMLQLIVQRMGAKFDGDVIYTVSMSCPGHMSAVKDIMSWKQTARRSLAEGAVISPGKPTLYASSTVYPPADQNKASRTFTTKACAYGGFILLLYFSLAAVWCMCNMPMKQDTMLFGAKKTE